MTADLPADELAAYVTTWSEAVDDVLALAADVPEADWARDTDLPGWTVADVFAHLAHLEHLLAGGEHEDVEIGSPQHVTSMMDQFTEQGIVARRDRTPAEVIEELRAAVAVRRAELAASPPTDPEAAAPGLFGAIGWSTRTLLRNRPLDVWMHDQDIRRAVGQPGAFDSAAARHTVDYLAASLGYVVAKRVGAPAGTSVTLNVSGVGTWSVLVDENGRAGPVEAPAEPTVRLSMDVENFGVMAGGRRAPASVSVTGDDALAARIVENFGVTP